MHAERLTVVTWLWGTQYTPAHVHAVYRMVADHLHLPYRFVCVTDQPEALACETWPLWDAPAIDGHDGRPQCWRRLFAFSEEAQDIFGSHLLSIDLDTIILDDITDLCTPGIDFCILQGGTAAPYNGSLWYLRTGTRVQAWRNFDAVTSPGITRSQCFPDGRHYIGTDQSWLSYCLPGERMWTEADGIYQWALIPLRVLLAKGRGQKLSSHALPENCRWLFFAGDVKPWSPVFKVLHRPLWERYQAYFQGTIGVA